MAVNNMAGHRSHRPSAFVCADPPRKFHSGIWLDPGILKFLPIVKMTKSRGRLRQKKDGSFSDLTDEAAALQFITDMPNVWGFERRNWMRPDDTFFSDEGAAWGNLNAGVMRTGEPKTVCTMLLALRLLYYLGARTIFLIGVDFHMDSALPEIGNYAFEEKRDAAAISSNNSQYRIVNSWLSSMQGDGVFSRAGLRVFNCYEYSGLRAFPFIPFQDALTYALRMMPPLPFDLTGWYNSTDKKDSSDD